MAWSWRMSGMHIPPRPLHRTIDMNWALHVYVYTWTCSVHEIYLPYKEMIRSYDQTWLGICINLLGQAHRVVSRLNFLSAEWNLLFLPSSFHYFTELHKMLLLSNSRPWKVMFVNPMGKENLRKLLIYSESNHRSPFLWNTNSH